jgi:hypothetical protein
MSCSTGMAILTAGPCDWSPSRPPCSSPVRRSHRHSAAAVAARALRSPARLPPAAQPALIRTAPATARVIPVAVAAVSRSPKKTQPERGGGAQAVPRGVGHARWHHAHHVAEQTECRVVGEEVADERGSRCVKAWDRFRHAMPISSKTMAAPGRPRPIAARSCRRGASRRLIQMNRDRAQRHHRQAQAAGPVHALPEP